MPTCTPIMCQTPVLHDHVRVVSLNATFTGRAVLACHAGYQASNDAAVLFCGADGNWTGLSQHVLCTECPLGQFGMNCTQQCACQHGAPCNHVQGHCNCHSIAGYTGTFCELGKL